MQIIITTILISIISCIIILLIRNSLIFKYRMKALRKVDKLSKEAIDKGEDWHKYFNKYNEYGSYEKMVFNITKWKYSTFYPDL